MGEKQAQLEWEARAGRYAAAGAFVSAFSPILAAIYLNASLPTRIENIADQVVAIAKHPGPFYVASGIQVLGFLGLAAALYYLHRAIQHRLPATPSFPGVLAIVGPVLVAIALIVGQLDVANRAPDVIPVSDKSARDLLNDVLPIVRGMASGGGLALGAAMIAIGTYGMRAGLMSRFFGTLGAILGGLSILGGLVGQSGLGGPILLFWAGACGFLFIDKWPGGRGPAWETGEPRPWPSAADRAAEREEARAEREYQAGRARAPEPEFEPEPEPEPQPQRSPNARSRKRKKKSRR